MIGATRTVREGVVQDLLGIVSVGILTFGLVACGTAGPAQPAAVAHSLAPTAKPTARPTATPRPVAYPPQTKADLIGLAAKGDASQMHEFHSDSVGLADCPQPKRDVIVASTLTGQQLAEDLLAYFYAQQLNNDCGSVVFAYHSQGEANAGNGYTAGSVNLSATGSQHTLTIDIGSVDNPQQGVVTY